MTLFRKTKTKSSKRIGGGARTVTKAVHVGGKKYGTTKTKTTPTKRKTVTTSPRSGRTVIKTKRSAPKKRIITRGALPASENPTKRQNTIAVRKNKRDTKAITRHECSSRTFQWINLWQRYE